MRSSLGLHVPAIYQTGMLSGIHQGLSVAKVAFAAEGEANHDKEAIR